MSQYPGTPMDDDIPILVDIIEVRQEEQSHLPALAMTDEILEDIPAHETKVIPEPTLAPEQAIPPSLTQSQRDELALEVRLAVLNELQTELGLSLQQNLEQVMEEAVQETIAQAIEHINATLTSELQIRLRSSLQAGLQACLYAAIDEAVSKNLASSSSEPSANA